MKKAFAYIVVLLFANSVAFGAVPRTIDADFLRSSDRTKTWTPPSVSDTLVGTTATQTITNKTLTGNTMATITNGGTLTLPSGTDTIVGRATTDTLTNKTMTAPAINGGLLNMGTASSANAITLPGATKATLDGLSRTAGKIYYATDQTKTYIDNGSALVAVGSGSGGGTNKYLSGGDFESGSIGAAFKDTDATTGALTGGSPTATFTTTTTTPLEGLVSGLYTPGAAIGNGWSAAFSIFREDTNKVLQVEIPYEINTPANYTDGDLRCAVYDVTGATRLTILEGENIVRASGPATHRCKFQSTSSLSYRVGIVQGTTATTYSTVKIEGRVGPQLVNTGPGVSEWFSYIPGIGNLGNGSYTSTGKWRRVGDSMEINASFVKDSNAGTGSSAVFIPLPTGYSIDGNKLAITAGTGNVGSALFYSAGTGFITQNAIPQTTYITFTAQASGGQVQGSNVTASAQMTMDVRVPIVGWSANQVLSSDQGNAPLRFRANKNGTQALSSGLNKLTSFTVASDNLGAWDSTNNWLVVKKKGQLILGANGYLNTPVVFTFAYRINGGATNYWMASDASQTRASGSVLSEPLNVGDYIEFYAYAGSAATLQVSAGDSSIWAADPTTGNQQIAATEAISARYTTGSGQSLPNATQTQIIWGTKSWDTHSAMNTSTGVYTCPANGRYRVSISNTVNTANVQSTFYTYLLKNGSLYSQSANSNTYLTAYWNLKYDDVMDCKTGDTISYKIEHNQGTSQSLLATNAYNYINIERISGL